MTIHKPANTLYPVHELIKKRWSPRSFKLQEVTEKDMLTLLEAASWAFSANNLQPWFFIYAHHGAEGFEKILNCLVPANQLWAKNAPVLMISLAQVINEKGKPNGWAKHDLGAANLQLALQAVSMDIYAHPMAGFDKQKTIDTIPFDSTIYEPVTFIAFGYPDDAEMLEEPYRSRELAPRTRKTVGEFSTKI